MSSASKQRRAYFIAGTDTDAGKTFVACGMLEAAARLGWRTLGLKPLAAGSLPTPEGPRNADALALQHHSSLRPAYEEVNPVCLAEAIAPHLAARHEGRRLSLERLAGFCRGPLMAGAELCLIEGAGGWQLPLNEREFLSGLPRLLDLPVILVVGMRLGCLNHALLSTRAILADRVTLAGWVANRIDPDMACYEENRDTLRALIPAPLLAEVPYAPGDLDACAGAFDLNCLSR